MKVGKEKKEKYERQYWLWVTRPKYYLDKKGDDREELDPSTGVEDLWRSWTCSKEIQKGDLALLWRSKKNLNQYLAELGVKKDMGPDSDIGYLFQAESDAYSTDDEEIPSPGWSYGWGIGVRLAIFEFKVPHALM